MNKNFSLALMALALITFVSSCKKEEGLKGKGPLTIEFDNRSGTSNFALNTDYTIASGETVNISLLKYYVSNFVLVKDDGSEYTLPQNGNYFLIDEAADSTQKIVLNDIPAGNYTTIKYILGVDSLRSTMDVSQRTGALDPAGAGSDMYWSWNSGYIFFRIDATSPQSTEALNACYFHVGGYGGYSTPTTNNLRTISISSAEAAQIGEGRNPEAHVDVDIMEAFKSPTTYSIAADGAAFHMPTSAIKFADNYTDMFTINHMHND